MGRFQPYITKKLLIPLIFLALLTPGLVVADVWVNGYTRSNGTYVQGYYRSSPDGNPFNNYSFPGNTNPYTGKVAPGNASTYLNSYYYPSYSSSYTTPSYSNSTYTDYTSSYYPSPYYGSSYSNTSYGSTYTSRESVVGGYKMSGVLFCSSDYYEVDGKCKLAPVNSTAYGGYSFYCNSGYEKSGDGCKKKESETYSGSYSTYTPSTSNNSIADTGRCSEGSSWYLDGCITNMENAKYNGSSYTCDRGFVVNKAGTQCVGIDTYCKERHGISSYGDGGICHCNHGFYLDTITNMCRSR